MEYAGVWLRYGKIGRFGRAGLVIFAQNGNSFCRESALQGNPNQIHRIRVDSPGAYV
jgi:hypothetical protein